MTPAITEVIKVVECDAVSLEIPKTNLAGIEDACIIKRAVIQCGGIAIAQATDQEFMEMIVCPAECGLYPRFS